MSAIPPLFRYAGPRLVKRAGRAINEDPSTWQTEVARALANDHPYVDLEGSKIKMLQASPEDKKASGMVALKNGCAIHFSIRPDPIRGRPELDSIEILLDRGRLRHLNEQSYREAINNDPNLLNTDPQKNYSNPGTSNPYIGQVTGDQSPIGGHAHSQGILNSNFAHSIRNASGGVLSRFISNEEMLARLDASLKQLNGLSASAQLYGLHEAIGSNPKLHDSTPGDVPNAFVVLRDSPSVHIIIYPNKERVRISTRELKDMLGDNFFPIMKAITTMGYAVVQNYVKMNSIDFDRIFLNTPAITQQGWHRIQTGVARPGMNHVITAYFCPRQITLGGHMVNKSIVFDLEGGWMESCDCPFYGTPTSSPLSIVPPPPPYTHKRFNYSLGEIENRDMQEAWSVSRNRPPSTELKVGTGGYAMLFFEALGAATKPMKIVRMADVIDGPPLIEVITHEGQRATLRMMDMISRPTQVAKLGPLAGVDGMAYAIPADAEFIWVCPEPLEYEDSKIEMTRNERQMAMDPAQAMASGAHIFKFACSDSQLWLMNNERFNDRYDLICKVANMGVAPDVLAKVASLKPGQEWSVQLIDPQLGARQTKQAHLSKIASVVQRRPRLQRIVEHFVKAANEAAQGADQVAQQQPDVFDSTTVDGLLAMQFASTDTMVEIVQSESDFEDIEDKIAKMLLASRQGKTALDEDGLVRALRGMGEANKAIAHLKLELQTEGTL